MSGFPPSGPHGGGAASGTVTIQSLEHMHEMLRAILAPSGNEARRSAETVVVRSLRDTNALMALVSLVQDSASGNTSAGVRQLASVLLRKKITTLWRALPNDGKAELKRVLLQQLGAEPVRTVRFAIAHVVSRLCKAEAMAIMEQELDVDTEADGGRSRPKRSRKKTQPTPCWPELQHAIRTAVGSEDAEMRELAMILAYSIAEVFATDDGMSNLVAEAVLVGLSDSVVRVQLVALSALTTLLPFLHSHKAMRTQLICSVVPVLLQLIQQHGAAEDRVTLVVKVIEALEALVEELPVKANTEQLLSVAACLIDAFRNPTNQPRVRQNASEALGTFVTAKPKFVVAQRILAAITEACMAVLAEDDTVSLPTEVNADDDGDSDDEDADMLCIDPPCLYTCRLLSVCATKLPAKHVSAVYLPHVARVSDNSLASSREKKAAIILLASAAEGSAGSMRRRVTHVLQMTEQFLRDAAPVVREAAAFALGYFCSYLQPEILTHHDRIFPLLLPLLADPEDNVRRCTADALDHLCENVAENLDSYIPELLPRVISALSVSSTQTQKSLCCVISSMAMTQCPSFKAQAEECLHFMKQPFEVSLSAIVDTGSGGDASGTDPKQLAQIRAMLPLRAQATETVGIIASAIGKDAFRPYLPYFMGKIGENLRTKRAEVREQSFGFLSNICEAFHEEFLPFLDEAVGYAIQSLETDNAKYENKHLLAEAASSIHLTMDDDEPVGDDENDDDDDDAEDLHMRVRTADVEEKSSAAYCIGVFASVLKGGFGEERIRQCWDVLHSSTEFFHASVRSNVLVALAKLTIAAQGNQSVVPSVSSNTLTPFARELVDECVYEIAMPCLKEETEKDVVAAACEALQITVDFFGAQAFAHGLETLTRQIIELLQRKTLCQRDDEDEDDDDDESSGDSGDDAGGSSGTGSLAKGKSGLPADAVSAFSAPGVGRVSFHSMNGKIDLGEDHDEELMDSVFNLIEALAKAYGAGFAPPFAQLAPSMMMYAAEDRPAEDLVMATGTVATVLRALGPVACAPYFHEAIQLAFRLMQSTDESAAKANCCFLIRAVVENCPQQVQTSQEAQQLFSMLTTIVESDEEIPEAVDNAVAALCVLVMKINPAFISFATILPLFLLRVPMRVDKAENMTAVEAVVFVFTHFDVILAADAQQASVMTEMSLAEMVYASVGRMLMAPTVTMAEKEILVKQGILPFLNSGATDATRNQRAQLWMRERETLTEAIQLALASYGC